MQENRISSLQAICFGVAVKIHDGIKVRQPFLRCFSWQICCNDDSRQRRKSIKYLSEGCGRTTGFATRRKGRETVHNDQVFR